MSHPGPCIPDEHVYVAIHFFCIWSFWVDASLGRFFIVCLYPIERFNPTTFLCLSQSRRSFFNPISHGLFSCLMIWDERWLSFFVMGGTVYHHFLYFLFITLEPNWISDWQKDYAYHSMIWHVVYINNQLVEFTSSFRDDPALKQSGLTKIGLKQMRP